MSVTQAINKIHAFIGIALIILGAMSIAPMADSQEVETLVLMIKSKGLKWIGGQDQVQVLVEVGGSMNTALMEVKRGSVIEWSLMFTNVSTIASFSITIYSTLHGNVFMLDGVILRSSVRITRVDYNENYLEPNGDVLLELYFIGYFYSVDLDIPVRASDAQINVLVDDSPVQAKIEQHPAGIKVWIGDVMFLAESSIFEVIVMSQDHVIASIRGVVSPAGLKEISIVAGVLETISAKATVTNGTRRALVPSSILNLGFSAEESVQVIKVTEVLVTSTEIVRGNIPVKLLAFSRGSFLEPPKLIINARLEVTLTSLNVTKIYENNSTAFLPLGERVLVRAYAPGFRSQEQVFVVSNTTSEVLFHLEEEQPSPLQALGDLIYSVVTHRLFVPIMLGIIAGLVIVALIRRG